MQPVRIYNTDTGIPFIMRLVRDGESYGLNDCLINDTGKPKVEFYDARYPHKDLGGYSGQFVSRYYVETLLNSRAQLEEHGLTLDGGVDDWRLNDRAMVAALFILAMETT